jgi:hypothetical protein
LLIHFSARSNAVNGHIQHSPRPHNRKQFINVFKDRLHNFRIVFGLFLRQNEEDEMKGTHGEKKEEKKNREKRRKTENNLRRTAFSG